MVGSKHLLKDRFVEDTAWLRKKDNLETVIKERLSVNVKIKIKSDEIIIFIKNINHLPCVSKKLF